MIINSINIILYQIHKIKVDELIFRIMSTNTNPNKTVMKKEAESGWSSGESLLEFVGDGWSDYWFDIWAAVLVEILCELRVWWWSNKEWEGQEEEHLLFHSVFCLLWLRLWVMNLFIWVFTYGILILYYGLVFSKTRWRTNYFIFSCNYYYYRYWFVWRVYICIVLYRGYIYFVSLIYDIYTL